MEFLPILLTILGLSLFEIITSVDNAIINAEVLTTMGQRARRWFLTWGIFSSVFLVRGLLPLIIVWASAPSLGFIGAFTAALSNDPQVAGIIEKASILPLSLGGTFLIFIFLSWLFLEPKYFGLRGERFIQDQGGWFYTVVSVLLTILVWFALQIDSMLAFGIVLGSTIFFIVHGFRQYAEAQEKKLIKPGRSDISKLLYLEVIDGSFSIDGIVGAFAFTFSVPLILIGNGIGAVVLRKMTVSNIERVKKYKYLKNGAMYSVLVLGVIMLFRSFGYHIPEIISPVATFFIIGYFFYKSWKLNKTN